jgi:hypothetical protein
MTPRLELSSGRRRRGHSADMARPARRPRRNFRRLTRRRSEGRNLSMKISRLLPIVCVNVFVALPALASQPATGSPAPLSLCGESKADKGDKAEQTEATDKAEKKTDKKDAKEKKSDSKASA